MRRSTLLLAVLALAVAPAFATPTAVKGAKCTACHEKMPPKKDNLNAKAAAMFKQHKTVASCKDCHSVENGKFMSHKK